MPTDPPVTVDVPDHFRISIRLPGGGIAHIDGRVGKMIEWLAQQHDLIERMPFGSVHFDVSQRSFQPQITEAFPRVQTPREPE